MSLRRTIRTTLLFAPLLVFPLVLALPYCSARLSLVLHGFPFARVVPKENLDIFHYVQMDGFHKQAVVFSRGKAVGLIVQPLGSPAYFERFSGQANSVEEGLPPFGFIGAVVVASSLRWFLLPVQAIFLLLWLRQRERRVRYCGYDI